jgi:hypothetical protein
VNFWLSQYFRMYVISDLRLINKVRHNLLLTAAAGRPPPATAVKGRRNKESDPWTTSLYPSSVNRMCRAERAAILSLTPLVAICMMPFVVP